MLSHDFTSLSFSQLTHAVRMKMCNTRAQPTLQSPGSAPSAAPGPLRYFVLLALCDVRCFVDLLGTRFRLS